MSNKVFLEVDGLKYEGFKTIGFSKSIENLSGFFNFTASTQGVKFTPFKGQEECKIIINNNPVITGYIENITYDYDSNSHNISISGRDKTCDIIDNSVVGDVNFKAPISLKSIIQNTLDLSGIGPDIINVLDLVVDLEDFKQNELVSAEVGDNMFDYLEKYCRKRGVLLTSNGDGNIIITRSGQSFLPGVLVNKLDDPTNNIKSASISYDFTSRYFGYLIRSQGNFSAANLVTSEGLGLSKLESTSGSAIDTEIRRTRILEMQNETSSIDSSNIDRGIWEANIRKSRSLVYSCNLAHLFVDEKETQFFEPNRLIQVVDDFCDINSIMLIRSVNYELSDFGGTNVNLELVPKDSYSFDISENTVDDKYNKIGTNNIDEK